MNMVISLPHTPLDDHIQAIGNTRRHRVEMSQGYTAAYAPHERLTAKRYLTRREISGMGGIEMG